MGLGRFITPDWSTVPVPVPYADLNDPQSLNQYTYVRNLPTTRVDADGHDDGFLNDVVEAGVGFVRGAAASISYGAAGAPKSTDSSMSLFGQSMGTAMMANLGMQEMVKGGVEIGAGLGLAPETGGLSLTVSGAGALEAIGGAVVTAGATKNAGAILNAMAKKDTGRDPQRRFDAEQSKELRDRAQGKCETCGKKTVPAKPYTKGSKHSPREGQAGHKKAWSKGGRTEVSNGKWQCKKCNQQEGANSK
jgi:hypothetical protein